MLNFDEGILATTQEEILFYSPEYQKMMITRRFKRPIKPLKQEKGICPRCFRVSVITIHNPINKPYKDIKRSVCEKGHLELVIETRLDYEKSKASL